MEKIQEILFENKESIPNGLYLELMDQLKKSYITKNENELIKITYTRIRPTFQKSGDSDGCVNEYNIDLHDAIDMSVIVKKSDFIKYDTDIEKQLDAIPFIPFWTEKKSCFNDYGYDDSNEYIFQSIKKDEPDEDDNDGWNDEFDTRENKRKIKFLIKINYNIKYLITNVEKL